MYTYALNRKFNAIDVKNKHIQIKILDNNGFLQFFDIRRMKSPLTASDVHLNSL